MRRWRRPAPGSGWRITYNVGRGIRLPRLPPTAGVGRSLPLSAPVDQSLLLSALVDRSLPPSDHISRRHRVLSQQLVERASRWYISFWEIP